MRIDTTSDMSPNQLFFFYFSCSHVFDYSQIIYLLVFLISSFILTLFYDSLGSRLNRLHR